MYAEDVIALNTLKPSGMAPHRLKLKVNCIIMLLRNFDTDYGFCNGIRLIVKKLHNNSIIGVIFSDPYKLIIPRCKMTAKSNELRGHLQRIQFPVLLSFAMSINKS